jgi:hypothetical protein
MILQDGLLKHLHRTGTTCRGHGRPHVLNADPVETRSPSPRIPGDVGVQLVGSMVGHRCSRTP